MSRTGALPVPIIGVHVGNGFARCLRGFLFRGSGRRGPIAPAAILFLASHPRRAPVLSSRISRTACVGETHRSASHRGRTSSRFAMRRSKRCASQRRHRSCLAQAPPIAADEDSHRSSRAGDTRCWCVWRIRASDHPMRALCREGTDITHSDNVTPVSTF